MIFYNGKLQSLNNKSNLCKSCGPKCFSYSNLIEIAFSDKLNTYLIRSIVVYCKSICVRYLITLTQWFLTILFFNPKLPSKQKFPKNKSKFINLEISYLIRTRTYRYCSCLFYNKILKMAKLSQVKKHCHNPS